MFLSCLAQDFRCGTSLPAAEEGTPTYSPCYCEDIHGGPHHFEDNAEGHSPVSSAAMQLSMVVDTTMTRLRNHCYAPGPAYAYVTYGVRDKKGMLKVLRLEIVGPAG